MTNMINRQAILQEIREKICTGCTFIDPHGCAVCNVWGVICEIKDAPTIEPKCGEWERHPDFLHIRSANIHRCSLCKERPLYRMGNEVLSAFCPNCGAKMKGE